MNPAQYIRTKVFGCKTQGEFAVILDTSQVSVSRWEKAGQFPSRVMTKIRAEVSKRKLRFDDRWFFSAPTENSRREVHHAGAAR